MEREHKKVQCIVVLQIDETSYYLCNDYVGTYLLKYVVISYYWGTFVKFVLVKIDSISTNFA